ncbi:MAG: hypothetical protein ACXW2U_05205 [Telluria sp.]
MYGYNGIPNNRSNFRLLPSDNFTSRKQTLDWKTDSRRSAQPLPTINDTAFARSATPLIGDSVAKVDAGTQLVDQAGVTMDQIVESVRKVAAIMVEINASSRTRPPASKRSAAPSPAWTR